MKLRKSGASRIDLGGGERQGGESEADDALRGVPVFQLHAERVWEDVVDLAPWSAQPERQLTAGAASMRSQRSGQGSDDLVQ